ncbi:MAG: 16S rRNA processing protein RimM [Candidatus Promineifilaceae bacterium]|jgi:16S rRNA processing protein RimM
MSSPESLEPKYLVIGQITKPHGVRGELRIDVTTDMPERYHQLDQVLIAKNERQTPQTMEIESVRFHQEKALIKFTGYNYRDQVEEFRKWLVLIPTEQAIPLEEGEFFYYQLIGMEVVTDEGVPIGVVKEIIQTGANDVFVLQNPAKGEILIPDTEEVVTNVDRDLRVITIHVIPGLLE